MTVAMSPVLQPERCRSPPIASGVLILGEMAHAPKAGPAAAVDNVKMLSGTRKLGIFASNRSLPIVAVCVELVRLYHENG